MYSTLFSFAPDQDFFTNEPLSKFEDMDILGMTKCAANQPEQKVHSITDGKQDRCFVTVTPTNPQKTPMPVGDVDVIAPSLFGFLLRDFQLLRDISSPLFSLFFFLCLFWLVLASTPDVR